MVEISDGHGGIVAQSVKVKATGTNQSPTSTADSDDATRALTKDATTPNLSTTDTIAFNDDDLSLHDALPIVKDSGTLGGSLTMGTVNESATTEAGTVGWTYS